MLFRSFIGSSFTGSFVGDGSALTGIVSNLYLSASKASGGTDSVSTIALKTTPFIISGSYNKGLYASLSSNTLTLDLAQDIRTTASPTFATLNATSGSFSYLSTTGNVLIGGNLTVNGTTTIINSSAVDIGTSSIYLNYNGAANVMGGIYVIDNTVPTQATASLVFDPTNNVWVAGFQGGETRIVRQASISNLTQ